jgi:putative ABC transport system ATP-binding protein
MSDRQRTLFRRRRLGIVFQAFNLMPNLTALENVMLPLLVDGRPTTEVRRRADELIALVHLDQRVRHRPAALSGGEQQRVAIARALVTDPPLVLCDEPTGNLDEETGKRVLGLMRRLGQERNKTFAVVSHNSVIGEMADRVVRLRDGRIADVQVNETPAQPEELHW